MVFYSVQKVGETEHLTLRKTSRGTWAKCKNTLKEYDYNDRTGLSANLARPISMAAIRVELESRNLYRNQDGYFIFETAPDQNPSTPAGSQHLSRSRSRSRRSQSSNSQNRSSRSRSRNQPSPEACRGCRSLERRLIDLEQRVEAIERGGTGRRDSGGSDATLPALTAKFIVEPVPTVVYVRPRNTARGACPYCGVIFTVQGLKTHLQSKKNRPTEPRCLDDSNQKNKI